MDPDANLREQRELARAIIERFDRVDEHTGRYSDLDMEGQISDAERLAELIQALDEWITKGGFLPKDWRYCVVPQRDRP